MAVLADIPVGEIVRLKESDLIYFQKWANHLSKDWPAFTTWLFAFAESEMKRREQNQEPGMIGLPDLTGRQLADFLEATFVWRFHPQQESAVPFVEAVSMRVLARACTFLREADFCISLVENQEDNADE